MLNFALTTGACFEPGFKALTENQSFPKPEISLALQLSFTHADTLAIAGS